MKKLNLNENFICRIWEDKSYYSDLKTLSGEDVEVLDTGQRNSDAGPDYSEARIKIGGKSFSGSVEIHKYSKDWFNHKHNKDDKYNKVILQIVMYSDDVYEDEMKTPLVKKSRLIPTVILSDFLTKPLKEIWKEIINNPSGGFKLPCFPKNLEIPGLIKNDFFQNLGTERLEYKSERMNERFNELSGDYKDINIWEQILFEFICEALGFSKNKNQFLKLAKNISIPVIKLKSFNILSTDSLLFGISGFLKDLKFKDSYIDELKNSWYSQKKIFKPELMDKSEWNFFRLRPANFPTLRIAYASGILNEILNRGFFKKIINLFEDSVLLLTDLENYLKNINVSGYWRNNYKFGKPGKLSVNPVGKERINDLTVNVILPFVYLYAKIFCKINLTNRILYIFKKEKYKNKGNEVTRVMEKQTGKKINTISDEQALIQLQNLYCVRGRCRECEIGKIVFEGQKLTEPLTIIIY